MARRQSSAQRAHPFFTSLRESGLVAVGGDTGIPVFLVAVGSRMTAPWPQPGQ